MKKRWIAGLTTAFLVWPVWAQKSASQGIDEYRSMLQDGNPAELFEVKGEELWREVRGPKKAALAKTCDLGKGPRCGEGGIRGTASLF